MNDSPHNSAASTLARGKPVLRRSVVLFALTLLALVEGTWLTGRFDTTQLLGTDTLWSALLASSRILLPAGITIFAAFLLFARRSIPRDVSQRLAEPLVLGRRESLLVVLHLVSFLSFFALTARLFEGSRSPAALPTLAWAACGTLVVGSLFALALPPGSWRLARRGALLPTMLGVGVGILAWGAGQTTDRTLWNGLGRPTLHASAWLLRLCGVPATADAETYVLEANDFAVRIGVGCSGYEGIGLVWTFLSVYLWLFRKELRFPRALWLLPLGTALVWTANITRITALMIVGDRVSPELALGAFHTRFGWVLFTTLALGLAFVSHRSAYLRPERLPKSGTSNVAVDYLAPLAVLAGSGLLLGAFVPEGSPLLALAMVAALAALLFLRHRHDERAWVGTGRAFLAGALVFLLWILSEGSFESIVRWPASTETSLRLLAVIRILGFVCVVPWVEELAFRGYLMRRLVNEDVRRVAPGAWTWVALLGSSLLFGFIHERWIAATAAGLVYGLVYVRSRRLGEAVCAHGTTNALLVLRQLFVV